MDLRNDSPFLAQVQVANFRHRPMAAAAIIKATFDVAPDGALRPAQEPLPLVLDQHKTPFGEFHGELFFKKCGVDVCVSGSVRRSQPTRSARVQISVGRETRQLFVFGDRRWLHDTAGRDLVPSTPVPFLELPLSYARAYGGHASYNGALVPFPANPSGRGYYREQSQAHGQLLPNLEDDQSPPIARWSDQPRVAGWGPYPMFWELRAKHSIDIDPEHGSMTKVHPSIFNHAHPDLVFPSLATGERIRIDGLHDAPYVVQVPAPPALVRVQIGDVERELEAPIDGVFLWTDANKLVVTQRARFEYWLRHEEIRCVTVSAATLR